MEPNQIHVLETSVLLKGSFLYSDKLSAYQKAATVLGKQY
jgi:hypothetical protein